MDLWARHRIAAAFALLAFIGAFFLLFRWLGALVTGGVAASGFS